MYCMYRLVFLLICLLGIIFGNDLSTQDFYSNPLINGTDYPDPGVFVDHKNGIYYVTTTTMDNNDPNKFPILSSVDLVHWSLEGHIFTESTQPIWSSQDFWAPEIHRVLGSYLAYFVARDLTGMLCVGVAISVSGEIWGPYKDIGFPLVRNETYGSIDPTIYQEKSNGHVFLFWKEDGNGHVPPTKYSPIWGVQMESNGLSFKQGAVPVLILQNDPNSWEGPIVEAPWVIKPNQSKYYYLFYSANRVATYKYGVGVAYSTNIFGPYVKYQNNPILHNNTAFDGPGHCAVIQDANVDGQWVMVYHSWIKNQISGIYPRLLMMDVIDWNDGFPTINSSSPSIGPTPAPSFLT